MEGRRSGSHTDWSAISPVPDESLSQHPLPSAHILSGKPADGRGISTHSSYCMAALHINGFFFHWTFSTRAHNGRVESTFPPFPGVCILSWIIALLQTTKMIYLCIFNKLFRKAHNLLWCLQSHFTNSTSGNCNFSLDIFQAENCFCFTRSFMLFPWACPTWLPHLNTFLGTSPNTLWTYFCELECYTTSTLQSSSVA